MINQSSPVDIPDTTAKVVLGTASEPIQSKKLEMYYE